MSNRNIKDSEEEVSSFCSKIFFRWPKNYINNIIKSQDNKNILKIPSKYRIEETYKKYLVHINSEKGKITKREFIVSLIKTYKVPMFMYFIFTLIVMSLEYGITIIYPTLLNTFRDKSEYGNNAKIISMLVCIFIILKFGSAIFRAHKIQFQWKTMTSIQALCRHILFNNLIESNNENEYKFDSGKLLNMYSVHCAWLRGIVYLAEAIVNLAGVLVGFILITIYLGLGGVIGGSILILFSPIFAKVFKSINQNDGELHNSNDYRLSCVSEIITFIRELKLLNLKEYMLMKVKAARKKQSQVLFNRSKKLMLLKFISVTTIPIVGIISISISILTRYNFNFGQVFTAFIVFNILDNAMASLIDNLNVFRQAVKSSNYIVNFLNIDKSKDNLEILLQNNKLYNDKENILDEINLDTSKNELIVILGDLGSGKTKLLESIFKKIDLVDKSAINISNNPWTLPVSLRENIILNKKFDEKLYKDVIQLTQLEKDINTFKYKDYTYISDQAINISGGQIVRIQLARAMYFNPEIIFIDNILNSLDINVRRTIISELILKYWNNKTRIIVTTDKLLIEKADKVVLMNNMNISFVGTFSDFKQKYGETFYCKADEEKNKKLYLKDNTKKIKENVIKESSVNNKSTQISGLKILFQYINIIMKKQSFFVLIGLFLSVQLVEFGIKIVTSYYSVKSDLSIEFIIVYFSLALLLILINLSKFYIIFIANVRGGQKYHDKLIKKVIGAKMNFFYRRSNGEILSRFSNDMSIIDNDITNYIIGLFESIFSITVTMVLIVYSSPYMVFIIAIFLFKLYNIQKEIRITAKATSKLVNTAHEPCLSVLKSSIEGLPFIHQLNLQSYILDTWKNGITRVLNSEYTRQSVNRFQLLKMDLNGFFIVSIFLIILSTTNFDSNIVAVSLTSALMVLDNFQSWLINIRHTEIAVASLRRINQFIATEQEVLDEEKIASINIREPNIEIKDMSCKYNNSKYIINKLSINIKSGERLLIVGRTGSGKTTFFNCLAKLMDYKGSIKIDNIELNEIDIYNLRNIIFSIPQKAFLFSGTICENLDPYKKYTNDQIWDSIKKVNLDKKILSFPDKLQTKISPTNLVFSSGEQQLLSLARAILNKPKILLIDEGNSQIDENADNGFYTILSKNFKKSTIISISHNISNYDFYNTIINIENYN